MGEFRKQSYCSKGKSLEGKITNIIMYIHWLSFFFLARDNFNSSYCWDGQNFLICFVLTHVSCLSLLFYLGKTKCPWQFGEKIIFFAQPWNLAVPFTWLIPFIRGFILRKKVDHRSIVNCPRRRHRTVPSFVLTRHRKTAMICLKKQPELNYYCRPTAAKVR